MVEAESRATGTMLRTKANEKRLLRWHMRDNADFAVCRESGVKLTMNALHAGHA